MNAHTYTVLVAKTNSLTETHLISPFAASGNHTGPQGTQKKNTNMKQNNKARTDKE